MKAFQNILPYLWTGLNPECRWFLNQILIYIHLHYPQKVWKQIPSFQREYMGFDLIWWGFRCHWPWRTGRQWCQITGLQAGPLRTIFLFENQHFASNVNNGGGGDNFQYFNSFYEFGVDDEWDKKFLDFFLGMFRDVHVEAEDGWDIKWQPKAGKQV